MANRMKTIKPRKSLQRQNVQGKKDPRGESNKRFPKLSLKSSPRKGADFSRKTKNLGKHKL